MKMWPNIKFIPFSFIKEPEIDGKELKAFILFRLISNEAVSSANLTSMQ